MKEVWFDLGMKRYMRSVYSGRGGMEVLGRGAMSVYHGVCDNLR